MLALGRTSTPRLLAHGKVVSRHSALLYPALTAHTRSPVSNRAPTLRANMTATPPMHALDVNNINPHVKRAKYAVRGELAIRAEKFRQQLEAGDKSLPFDKIISANIGNPQQLDQKPITFFRQVLSLIEYPGLLDESDPAKVELVKRVYPSDVIRRAKAHLYAAHSVGAYSHSQGVPHFRDSVARFIMDRDGHPADPERIYLTAGASSGVNTLLHVICSSPETGIMIPIPQYPLYTATLALLNARVVPYYLQEDASWGTDVDAMYEVVKTARSEGTDVKCIVVINPGNPTGACLEYSQIENIIKLAAKERLVVMADEVYQTNVFRGKFVSFKKVLRDLQKAEPGPYDNVELVSLHSVSKGMVGECGHRGGYFELVGFHKDVVEQIYKFVSISLCPPVIGQCLVEMMVNPPKEGDPSHELYTKEYQSIYNGLKERATALYNAFKEMEGVTCEDPQGAMYIFPSITLPEKAVQEAEKEGRKADEFYCMRLLEATGVCVVPGSGFGQKDGTWHFRTTFLAPGTDWTGRIVEFHRKFMEEFK